MSLVVVVEFFSLPPANGVARAWKSEQGKGEGCIFTARRVKEVLPLAGTLKTRLM